MEKFKIIKKYSNIIIITFNSTVINNNSICKNKIFILRLLHLLYFYII